MHHQGHFINNQNSAIESFHTQQNQTGMRIAQSQSPTSKITGFSSGLKTYMPINSKTGNQTFYMADRLRKNNAAAVMNGGRPTSID